MFLTSADFKTGMAEPSRQLTARGLITYTVGTQALTSAEISKIQITENAGEHLPLGGVSASTLTLSLDNRQGEWNPGGSILGSHSLDGATVKLEVGVYHNLAYQYSNLGIFVLEDVIGQEQETLITLKGADKLANAAGVEWADGLTYPKTVIQILTEACSQAGITLKSTVFTNSTQSIATKPIWDENTTCRDVIGYVACLGAGFARIDRNGELEIIGLVRNAAGDIDDLLNSYFTYTDGILTFNSDDTVLTLAADGNDLTANPDGLVTGVGNDLVVTAFWDGNRYYVYPSRYKTLTRHGAIFGPFNALSVYEYGAPNGTGATRIAVVVDIVDNELNSVAVQGNPLLSYELCDTLMANMLTALSGLTFHGALIAWQGDPTITCGDFADVYSLNDEAIPLLVLNQTITLDSGFSMSSGNNLNSKVKGKAKTEYMRVFTPTGRLNAAALDGDINIRAGRQLNMLAGADIKVKAGANFDIEAGGTLSITTPAELNITAGTGTSAVGVSNDSYFLWAGSETASTAPFRVSMSGSVVATKIQHEYSNSYWDMADDVYPAEFPVYIPAGYTIDSVAFTFKTNKARTFAKGATAGGGQTSSSGGAQTSSSGGGATVTSTDGGGSTVTSGGGGGQTSSSSDPANTGPVTGNTGGPSQENTGVSGELTTGTPSANNTGDNASFAATGALVSGVAKNNTGGGSEASAGPSTANTTTPSNNSTSTNTQTGTIGNASGSTAGPNTANTGGIASGSPEFAHTHTLNSHTHGLNSHSHDFTGNSHTHDLQNHAHGLNSHTHGLSAHTHDMAHYHNVGAHSHPPGSHTHTIAAPGHTHSLGGHTHNLGSHTHDMNLHTHTVSSHNHSVTVAAHSHSVTVADHTHTVADHTHTVADHTHALDYGINEKAALATSCVLKANGTTINTYSPDPAAPVEIKANLSAGWNTVTVQPDDDARITAFVLVKLTPA